MDYAYQVCFQWAVDIFQSIGMRMDLFIEEEHKLSIGGKKVLHILSQGKTPTTHTQI